MRKDIGKALGLFTQIAVSMLVPIAICLFVGKWLDRLFGTTGICMIVFIVLGIGAGFRSVYMLTRSFHEGKDSYIDTSTTKLEDESSKKDSDDGDF